MKEEHVKNVHDGKIVDPSVTKDNEDESEFQRVNRKDIKTRFKSKKNEFD